MKKQLEVDFVRTRCSVKYYIQSAYRMETAEKTAQEIRSFMKIHDSFKTVVIAFHTPKAYYTEEGVLVMSIFDFLQNRSALEQL